MTSLSLRLKRSYVRSVRSHILILRSQSALFAQFCVAFHLRGHAKLATLLHVRMKTWCRRCSTNRTIPDGITAFQCSQNARSIFLPRKIVEEFSLPNAISFFGARSISKDKLWQYLLSNVTDTEHALLRSESGIVHYWVKYISVFLRLSQIVLKIIGAPALSFFQQATMWYFGCNSDE